ncbi:MAG TPA: ferritin-like domain-containing protein [Usitatibacter sp.]|nr:ferritin-like domain-containing protein [Usitatibacter sp.]
MSFFAFANDPPLPASRRRFLRSSSGLLLSGTAVALLSGREALAKGKGGGHEGDVKILNAALGAEHEAVAAYQVGADSGLLQPQVKDLALVFQGHHRAHSDVLASTIRKLGGNPVEAKGHYDFPTAKLKSEADVLAFAASLEKGAVHAYVEAVPMFHERDLSKAAASILGDEAMHWAILRNALGEVPVPTGFVG